MADGPTALNRAFNLVPKRAETGHIERLRETFMDSGIVAVLAAADHQVLYGRRGTGKTHALRYLEAEVNKDRDIAVYVDLRTVGSLEGTFAGEDLTPQERAARLLVDMLHIFHDSLLEAALNDDTMINDRGFTKSLDELLESIRSVRLINANVETSTEMEQHGRKSSVTGIQGSFGASPAISGNVDRTSETQQRVVQRDNQTGVVQRRLNFSEVSIALKRISDTLTARRVWLLLDEWSSVTAPVQPYLAEFLVKCIVPLSKFVIKIGAIEQQSNFRTRIGDTYIGLEVGADVSANISLDEFMVFDQNQEQAVEFFRGLLYKHVTSDLTGKGPIIQLSSPVDLVRQGFTDRRAFDELVRAAEGVPRDAINVAARAALRAGSNKIAINDVRVAARGWFQSDKENAIQSHEDALRLLNWIVDDVIRGKKSKNFLVNQRDSKHSLLLALFDARVLHVVRRGYSAQDWPGVRYDVYAIDYGTYVDLIGTKSEPARESLETVGLGLDEVSVVDDGADVDVPTQDLRVIRRIILDFGDFYAQNPGVTRH